MRTDSGIRTVKRILALGCCLCLISGPVLSADAPGVQRFGYQIVHVFPHDPDAWTQGLAWSDGFLYEGTGRYGHSSVRRICPRTGKILSRHRLNDQFYGEGLALFRNRLYQLTWHSKTGFVYDRADLRLIRRFSYDTQGWGLAHDGQHLILSNGSAVLRFLEPSRFREVRRITVRENGQPVRRLNELEYVAGRIYANVWKTDRVVIIAPDSGQVVGKIDLTGLLEVGERGGRQPDVLNGIAYDAAGRRLFVTGKYWPSVFEIRPVPLAP
ncbi:glutamine cyclotransferase [Desulfonema ishimotonii]|uniref:Glutamine cyclotransferase n=1 Tax=Desulfonema ishimotonii TaxID=45657 RepID=A0A401G1Z3_9BACT|nr:glutaminyl-peptide cyclotransferase [Desulfonema ishimotonii]GBC63215.1 glutamine cyclotransferase [Desulfonema ishimotonii]